MSKKEKYVVYVGTYTYDTSLGIHIYDLDIDTGVLTERKIVPINNPSDLIVSKNGKYLYSIADEGVKSFAIGEDGDLTEINGMWNGGMRGCYLDIDEEGKYLYIAGYHDGRISMMELNPTDGSIVRMADGVFHRAVGRSVADRSSRPHINCVKLTPDEHYVCAVDGGLDHVKIYKVDKAEGKLKMVDILRGDLDSAPRMMRFSKNGNFAYILNELKNTINVYKYYEDERGPEFERIQTVLSESEKVDNVCSALDIEFSADGKYLLASNDDVNSVNIFEADPETGLLTHICSTRISGEFPKAIAVVPGNRHFLVANHETNEITCFEVNYDKKYALMNTRPVKVDKPNCMYIHKL